MMNMKSKIGEIALLAALMSGGYETLGGNRPDKPYVAPPLPKRLPSYKHSGDVPNGCKLETLNLTFQKIDRYVIPNVQYSLHLDVDIVYGSEKAKQKRIIKYQNEIQEYIQHLPIEEIISRGEFKHELVEENKALV